MPWPGRLASTPTNGPPRIEAQLRLAAVQLRAAYQDISHLVGHASTKFTEQVYRKELGPMLTKGATAGAY